MSANTSAKRKVFFNLPAVAKHIRVMSNVLPIYSFIANRNVISFSISVLNIFHNPQYRFETIYISGTNRMIEPLI